VPRLRFPDLAGPKWCHIACPFFQPLHIHDRIWRGFTNRRFGSIGETTGKQHASFCYAGFLRTEIRIEWREARGDYRSWQISIPRDVPCHSVRLRLIQSNSRRSTAGWVWRFTPPPTFRKGAGRLFPHSLPDHRLHHGRSGARSKARIRTAGTPFRFRDKGSRREGRRPWHTYESR
jgi:hypothetical protein